MRRPHPSYRVKPGSSTHTGSGPATRRRGCGGDTPGRVSPADDRTLPMSLAALFSWLITAGGGLYLLTIWLIEYDHEFQAGAATRLPVPVISAHALLAIAGLGLWGYYLFSGAARLAWAAVADLAIVAVLGLIMAARWIGVYRPHRTPRVAVAATGAHSAS